MPDYARLRSWLRRRNSLLFVNWYLLVLLPTLLVIVVAAQIHEVLGAAALLASLVVVGAAGSSIGSIFSGCRELAETTTTIDGTDLVSRNTSENRVSLHSGEVTLLPPGSKRGYGKAWLLGSPEPCLLLGDPRTGRLRGADDLRTLSAVLRESPEEAGRAAGRRLDQLAVNAPAADQPTGTERRPNCGSRSPRSSASSPGSASWSRSASPRAGSWRVPPSSGLRCSSGTQRSSVCGCSTHSYA